MNPFIQSYLNHDYSISACSNFMEKLEYKPNLQKKLEEFLVFLNHLKTQMLRERINAIMEESCQLSFSNFPTDIQQKIVGEQNILLNNKIKTGKTIFLFPSRTRIAC